MSALLNQSQASHKPTFIRGDLAWRDEAFCTNTDPELFFSAYDVDGAKLMCEQCSVVIQCLEYSMAADERYGVWGGMDENERAELRKGVS